MSEFSIVDNINVIPGSATGGKVPGSPEPRAGAPAPPPLIAKDSALMGSPFSVEAGSRPFAIVGTIF